MDNSPEGRASEGEVISLNVSCSIGGSLKDGFQEERCDHPRKMWTLRDQDVTEDMRMGVGGCISDPEESELDPKN